MLTASTAASFRYTNLEKRWSPRQLIGLLNGNHMLPALLTLLLHKPVWGDYPLVNGNLIFMLQLGLFSFLGLLEVAVKQTW